ncbi:ribonuclease HI [Rhodococcus triatomae]|nr:hypothetical protein G419_13906 [Rhodococcus triatomae BKS 15-14]
MSLAVILSRQTTRLGLSFAGVAVTDGNSLHTQVLVRAGADSDSRQAVVLDAFETVYRQAMTASEPVTLHVNDAEVRARLRVAGDSFPAVHIVDTARGRVPALLQVAGTAISTHLAELTPRRGRAATPQTEATVATDASKCTGRPGVGVACVRSDGAHRQKVLPDVRSVLHGELLAIELAVASFANRPLHVLSDSKGALACLGGDHPNLGDVATTVERIRQLARGRAVRYSWVRGHDGHPLNETAHRLAVAARRGHEADIPSETRNALADNIVANLVAASPGTRSASNATAETGGRLIGRAA